MLATSNRFSCIISGNTGGFNCLNYKVFPCANKRKNTSIKYLSSFFRNQQLETNSTNKRPIIAVINNVTLRNLNDHYKYSNYSTSSFKDKLKEESNKLTGFNLVTSFPGAPGGVTRANKKWLTKKKKKTTNTSIGQNGFTLKQISPETYQHLCDKFPQIEELDENEVRNCIAEGAVYGFGPSSVSKMLCRYPELLHNYQFLFPNSAKSWRLLGFSERERLLMFLKNPQLMGVSFTSVAKGYGFLSHYFSSKELVILIKNNPQCVVESDIALREKVESLWKNYSHSTLSIAQSEALSREMNQITIRHEFLIRAGLLKVLPHRKFLKLQAEEDTRRIVKIRDKYFTPNEIVCSSEEKFLDTCTKNELTLAELSSFGEILIFEQEQKILEETHESDNEEEDVVLKSKNVTNSSQNTNSDDDDDCIDPNPNSYYVKNSHGFFNPIDEVEFYY